MITKAQLLNHHVFPLESATRLTLRFSLSTKSYLYKCWQEQQVQVQFYYLQNTIILHPEIWCLFFSLIWLLYFIFIFIFPSIFFNLNPRFHHVFRLLYMTHFNYHYHWLSLLFIFDLFYPELYNATSNIIIRASMSVIYLVNFFNFIRFTSSSFFDDRFDV